MGASDATLLNMLNISPFSYGLLVEMVYDSGTIFEPRILDIKPEDLRVKFIEVSCLMSFSRLWLNFVPLLQGVSRVASLCLAINYPTIASAPHSIINGFKNLLAVAAVTDIEFKEANMVKEFLKVSAPHFMNAFRVTTFSRSVRTRPSSLLWRLPLLQLLQLLLRRPQPRRRRRRKRARSPTTTWASVCSTSKLSVALLQQSPE